MEKKYDQFEGSIRFFEKREQQQQQKNNVSIQNFQTTQTLEEREMRNKFN